MRRRNTWFIVAVGALAAMLAAATPARAGKFRILVGNDDGVGAAGLAELVKVLSANIGEHKASVAKTERR